MDSMLSDDSLWNVSAINSFLFRDDLYCRIVNPTHLIRSRSWMASSDHGYLLDNTRITACFCRGQNYCNETSARNVTFSMVLVLLLLLDVICSVNHHILL